MMKTAINITLGLLVYGIVGGMEMNSIGMKNGVFSVIAIAIFLCLINRKKSATYRTRNGQVRSKHTKLIHKNCTPYKGGVSSGL